MRVGSCSVSEQNTSAQQPSWLVDRSPWKDGHPQTVTVGCHPSRIEGWQPHSTLPLFTAPMRSTRSFHPCSSGDGIDRFTTRWPSHGKQVPTTTRTAAETAPVSMHDRWIWCRCPYALLHLVSVSGTGSTAVKSLAKCSSPCASGRTTLCNNSRIQRLPAENPLAPSQPGNTRSEIQPAVERTYHHTVQSWLQRLQSTLLKRHAYWYITLEETRVVWRLAYTPYHLACRGATT